MLKTDWDRYYNKLNITASFTRKITTRVLINFIKTYITKKKFSIMEIGGANSCFYEAIEKEFSPTEYIIIDNNKLGLDIFLKRSNINKTKIKLINNNILNPLKIITADLVFSVGLIEHFSITGTRKVLLNHFKYLNKDGVLIISFPTPTFLYRIIRKIIEILKLWIFYDERPIKSDEFESVIEDKAVILKKKIIWSIFLTQAIYVLKEK